MSKVRNTSRLVGTAGVTPGSYILESCNITASDETVFDIKQLIVEIIITESIYTVSLDCELIILDGVNLFEEIKLNGDEKIELHVKRTELDTKNTEHHKHTFYISEVLNFARNKNGSASYSIRGVSKHAYISNTKTLNEFKEGTIGDIIRSICKSDLKVKEMDINVSTSQNISCIIPKLRPLAAIRWLNNNAFTSTGAPFYFFETLKSKVKYKSYEDFVDNADEGIETREYRHTPVQQNKIGSADYFKEQSRRIRKLSSELNLSKFIAINEGAYASTTKSIDVATKVYNTTNQYTYNNIKKLNKNNPFPKRNNNDQYDGRPVNQLHSGKNYFISLNSKSHNFHAPVMTGIGTSQSYLSTEDTLSHDIVIPGNFNLEVGQVLKLTVNKTSAQDNISSPIDKMQSGKYLITTIIHKFADEYTQNVEIKTNSFNADLNDILKIEGKQNSKEVINEE